MKKIDVASIIESPSALTQEQGDIIYNEIVKAIDNNEEIEIDFCHVESMISPFLNNAIGQLYGRYKTDQIKKYLKLVNIPVNKKATVNIVINNAKKFYCDEKGFKKLAKEVLEIE